MGKCCVSGAGEIRVDYKAKTVEMAGKTYNEGDWISLNGSTGEVYDGQVPTVMPELGGDFGQVMNFASKYTHTLVRTNADTPRDAKQARYFGAQGIGQRGFHLRLTHSTCPYHEQPQQREMSYRHAL